MNCRNRQSTAYREQDQVDIDGISTGLGPSFEALCNSVIAQCPLASLLSFNLSIAFCFHLVCHYCKSQWLHSRRCSWVTCMSLKMGLSCGAYSWAAPCFISPLLKTKAKGFTHKSRPSVFLPFLYLYFYQPCNCYKLRGWIRVMTLCRHGSLLEYEHMFKWEFTCSLRKDGGGDGDGDPRSIVLVCIQ